MKHIIPQEHIENKIYFIRGERVMLDNDLACLYGVSTKVFNQAVKRKKERFPGEFMFQLTKTEYENLRSQIVTSNWGGRRYLPLAFTEHGIAQLSVVLNSKRAIQVNIQIIKSFIKLRQMALKYKDIWQKIEEMEKKYDKKFAVVFEALKSILLAGPEKPKKIIGFTQKDS